MVATVPFVIPTRKLTRKSNTSEIAKSAPMISVKNAVQNSAKNMLISILKINRIKTPMSFQ